MFTRKLLLLLLLFTIAFSGTGQASAASDKPEITAILEQIKKLEKQVAELQSKTSPLQAVFIFTKNLRLGSTGEEVSQLQKYLKTQPLIYPEGLVTAYFGSLTEKAVKKFQEREGIEPVGIVGPKTRARLNELIALLIKPVPTLPPPPPPSEPPPPLRPASPAKRGEQTQGESPPPPAPISQENRQFELKPRPKYDLQALSMRVQELVSQRRKEIGLNSLEWSEAAAQVAAAHSADQARDNQELTNPALACHYPIIRHEGFVSGFTLKDRFQARAITFKTIGENVAIVPVGKNFTYRYPLENRPPPCAEVEEFKDIKGSEEEVTKKYKEIFGKSLELVRGLKPVDWVNQEWLTFPEIAEKVTLGWFNSPGHKENMLDPDFTSAGMGISEINNYLIFTHNFIGR